MEETISLKEVFGIIKKRLLLIITITLVAISAAAIVSFYFITPIYQAQTQILVNQKGSSADAYSWSQIETDLQLINTYNDIITSPIILSEVIKELGLNITPEQLMYKIALSSESESKVFKIIVEDSNPEQAVNIANTTAEVFKENVPSLLSVDNINILSSAKLSENPAPVKPNKILNISIGTVIGLMLGIGLVFLLEIIDTTIKTEKDVEEFLNIPIMGLVGVIPLEKEKKTSIKSRHLR